MGPENSNATHVAYIDGGPVVIGRPLPEITPDYSAGGVSAADAAEELAARTRALADASVTVEVAVKGIQEFFYAVELDPAVHFAKVLEPAMARRYLHTKKKRTRKKYEKRITKTCLKIYDVKGEGHSLSQYIIAATAHLWQMMDAVMGKEDNVSLQTAYHYHERSPR